MVIALFTLFAALVGSLAGSFLAHLVAGRPVHSHGDPGADAPATPGGRSALRKPVYGTPEKAALAEEGRKTSLPPQWQRIPTERR